MDSFAERLAAGIRKSKTPTLVGLDPRFESLPEPLTAGLSENNRVEVAGAFQAFCKGVIDVVAPLVAVVKPQAAFFEQVGVPGMAALALRPRRTPPPNFSINSATVIPSGAS